MKHKASKKYDAEDKYILQLYVSGMNIKSMEAIENVKRICEEYLHDCFELEVIDLYRNPEMASENHIIFSPSLVKLSPLPQKTLIGNFSDTEKVIQGLGIIKE